MSCSKQNQHEDSSSLRPSCAGSSGRDRLRSSSRRDFLKYAGVSTLGLGATVWSRPLLGRHYLGGGLPQAAELTPKYPGRVVEVFNDDVIPGSQVQQNVMAKMLERGMLELTGAENPADAWRQFVTPEDVVGLKVNTLSGPGCSTRQELVEAIIESLKLAGVKESNIIIWDRFESHLRRTRYKIRRRPGAIRCYATDSAGVGSDMEVYYKANVFEWIPDELLKGREKDMAPAYPNSHFSKIFTQQPWAVLVCAVCAFDVEPAYAWSEKQPQEHREWVKEAKLAGSKSCEKCHPEHFQRWQDSVHSKMVQIPKAETVVGDFTDENLLHWKGYTYKMFMKDDKFFMTVRPPRGEGTTYPIDYTVGSRRIQGYMSALPDGRLYLLPAYWHMPTRTWFDSSRITPHTEEGVGVKQYWNTNCLACHATDLKFDFDPETKQYSTSWLELAIGCEACHNPGSKHNEFFEAKPQRDYVRKDLNDTYISNQRFFDFVRSTELCVYCHGTKINYFPEYWLGDKAYDYFAPTLMSVGAPDQQGEHYPDGRPTRFNHSLGFMGSRCFLEGKATCISCHDGHSSENDSLLLVPMEQSNSLCLNCHQDKYGGTKLTEHTFHLPDSPGSRCLECHMGESLERVMMHRRDHSLDNPIPENSIRFGVLNTCNENCHADKSAEWSIEVLNQWYGDENRKKLLYASEAMYSAKVGDPKAVPMLVRVMKDTNLRLILRASAISFLGKQLGPEAKSAIPDLIEQLEAEHPLLQMSAAEALGRIEDASAIEPISRLLDHDARVVRVIAASAMINLGVTSGKGEMGKRFEGSKAEYLQSLESWPNVPDFRINIGNLHLLDSKFEEAASEYKVALQLDPASADAWYYLGMTYVRMEQWDEAIDAWSELKRIDPEYGNLDQLISSAKRERKKR